MKLFKMLEVIQTLERHGASLHGDLFSDSTGELKLTLTAQPSKELHEFLLKKRFVVTEAGTYAYRP